MSTQCGIGMERQDGTVTGIYCHYDGYPAGVGATLHEHYLDPAKVAELVSLGSVASVGHTLDKPPAEPARTGDRIDDRQAAREKFTTFYGRDCGWASYGPVVSADVEGFRVELRRHGVEFLYLFGTDGRWRVSKPYGRWRSLVDVLAGGVELLDEPDPDRGPDVTYCRAYDDPDCWLVSPASSMGRQWLEDTEGGVERLELDDQNLEDTLTTMRFDGLIVERWEP